MIIQPTLALEIRLESLDEGPGLLPFNLGQARLITHYHTFLQYIELTDIENRLESVTTQLDYFQTKLDNRTFVLYELQINHLSYKLAKIRSQLKTLEPNRSKRGLVDGIGSIIKSITGNLDHTDAQTYNNAIRLLETNNDKILSELNEHISLNKVWMSRYSDVLSKLESNQERINSTLGLLLDEKASAASDLIRYAKFAQLLSIISDNTDDLFLEITRIEDTLAFIRASSTHHSMLSIDNLINMTNRLKSIYGSDQLLDADLREYYTIIKPGYYYTDNRIVIIFKFPIISIDKFELYRLAIVPNKYMYTFIPPYPYTATNGKVFKYIEAECPKFNQYHLCEEGVNHQPTRGHLDCIQGLIFNQSLEKSCLPTKLTLTKEAMEQLDDRRYTLIFPQPTRTELQCERREFISLHGSYLATIPQKCLLRTDQFTITNTNDRIRGQPMKITEIPMNLNITEQPIPHLQLNSVHLKSLHEIEDKILMQHPIQIDHAQLEQSIYHTTIPLYVVLFGATVLIVTLTIRRYNVCTKLRKPQSTNLNPENHQYEDAEAATAKKPVPATFSLKVLK